MKKKTNLNKKIGLLSGALLTGMIAGLSVEEIQAADLLDFASLGTGAEVRNELIDMNLDQNTIPVGTLKFTLLEGKCGGDEKNAKGDKKDAKKGDVKSEDAKGKTGESKCGEGKCGEGEKDAAVKDGEKQDSKEAKTSESKCGEGKCG